MNAEKIELGPTLNEFRSITMEFSPEDKGLSIGNHPLLKKVHNSFARPEPTFSVDGGKGKPEDIFHFVSYVPVAGRLYELDGLKPGPIDLGECNNDDWLSVATPVIQKRIEQYSQSEIRFNLMAIIKNKKQVYQAKIEELRGQKTHLEQTLQALGDMQTEERDGLDAELQNLNDKIEQYLGFVANEEAKFANWKTENIRRRHNYIPFLFNLLKVLAEKDLLVPLIDKAKDRQKQKDQAKATETAAQKK